MNLGHAIFKRMQRLQGGTNEVRFPRKVPSPTLMSTWGDYFKALIEQAKQNEIDPDMVWHPPTERPPDEGQRERFQGGTDDVYHRDELFFRPGHTPSPKEASRLYDPGPGAPQDDEQGHDADLAHLSPEEQAQEQLDWEKTIQWNLSITPNLTDEERGQVLNLNPKDWDDSTREKVGAANEKAGTDMQLQMGTANVNNPGHRLYMAMQGLRKPKPRKNQI